MRSGPRWASRWWIIPIILVPLLLLGAPTFIFLANDLAGAILGPPAIWNRTQSMPPKEDLVGRYVESERNWNRLKFYRASFTLNANGTVEANDLPWEFADDACNLTGSGTWKLNAQELEVRFVKAWQSQGVCKLEAYPAFVLAGHSKPYSLYLTLGDPDSGTGIWFKKEKQTGQ